MGMQHLLCLSVRFFAKVKRDAFVSARGFSLVNAVGEARVTLIKLCGDQSFRPRQFAKNLTHLRNERERGLALMLVEPRRRRCTAKAQLMLRTLICPVCSSNGGGGGAHQMLMIRQWRRCIAESQGCAATGEEEDALVRVRAGVVVLVE